MQSVNWASRALLTLTLLPTVRAFAGLGAPIHRIAHAQGRPLPLACTMSAAAAGATTVCRPETFQSGGCQPGVYARPGSALADSVLPSIDGLASWAEWYSCPRFLRNGHVHTIAASQLRKTAGVCYARTLLLTPDGGTVALDMLQSVLPDDQGPEACEFVDDDGSAASSDKDFLLLVAGLGGGSDDSYVRSLGAAAMLSGHWQVGVVNMRGCGAAPVTSPRFFSAFRGATDDVRLAIAHVRSRLDPGAKVAVVGWSNGATILNNCLADQATTHAGGRAEYGADAGVTLACPLNMPLASGNLKRWFHANVYDRAIARSLSSKIAEWQHLFRDGSGASRPVACWEGLGERTFVADESVLTGRLRTIRGIDEAITRRCFGFASVDEYYAHASSDQRLAAVDVPLLVINAADDPIAYLGPAGGELRLPDALQTNDKLALVLTAHGGHLGWCDAHTPWAGSGWIENVTLEFLRQAVRL